ncbi:MAG: ABC transporter substrate-binding protein [Chloroflexi bacterium]|nr:ABC transporter substrate-binding protein [Chloroflexota bacterium]
MRLTVSDVVSPSYFVATAAVELGFFQAEGVNAEFVLPPANPAQALRDGEIDFLGNSAYGGLNVFPDWRGGKLLCALSQHGYWFLAVRADLDARRGDVRALKGQRISATAGPRLALTRLLVDADIDVERDNVQVVGAPPYNPSASWSRLGIEAIQTGLADAYWGNAMRAELGVREGIAKVLLDVRRGDGPPAARRYTFPALITSDRLIAEQPQAAAGAVRAVLKTQRALSVDPSLATQVGRRWFPPEEAELIAELVRRDTPFYEPTISEDAVAGVNQFAQDVGLLSGPVPYEGVVATQFNHLWEE